MADVALLDFSGPPPGYAAWKNGKRADDRHAWAKYKAENDPPGMYEVWYGAFATNIAPPFKEGASALLRQAAIRAAAWRWYEARVELYNILRKLNPPREFWPLILTWSDGEWIEVHTFLVENADVIALGAADTLTFPTVLHG